MSKINKVCLAISTLCNFFDCSESLLLLSPVSYTELFLQLLKGLRWGQKSGSFQARLLYILSRVFTDFELEECDSLPCASLGIISTVHPNRLPIWLYLNLSRKKDMVVINLVLHLYLPLV